jgi:Flp pilus assembly pilin Flp
MCMLKKLVADESGQGMTEYAILLGTLAIGTALTLLAISGRVKSVFNFVSTSVNQVPTS